MLYNEYQFAAAFAVADLVGGLGDDGGDSAIGQQGADRFGGVGLVAADFVGAGAWSSRRTGGHPQMPQQDRKHRGIPGLAGSAQHHQGHPGAVDEVVDFGAQPAP